MSQGELFDVSKYVVGELPLFKKQGNFGICKKLEKITSNDLKFAQECVNNELLSELNFKTMFNSGIYVILAAVTDYTKQKEIYDKLQLESFDTPKAFLENDLSVKEIVSSAHYPNSKFSYVMNFARYWNNEVCDEFLEDIQNGREKEFELRDKLLNDVKGIAKKSSSLIMNKWGYEKVVPIDIWMIRFLKEIYGEEIQYNPIRGLSDSHYNGLEEKFRGEAEKRDFSPVFFQNLIWSMFSTFRKRQGIENQKNLFE